MNVQIEICYSQNDVILFCKTLTNHTIISINPIFTGTVAYTNNNQFYEVWYIIK